MANQFQNTQTGKGLLKNTYDKSSVSKEELLKMSLRKKLNKMLIDNKIKAKSRVKE